MALEGTLHEISLVDLFDIFQMGNKSGVLRIFGPSQHSTIYVTMGRLIDAAIYEAATQQLVFTGDDAIVQMLKWENAEFAFTHDPSTVRHPVTIFLPIDELVRLHAEFPEPIPHAAPALHMEVAIAANLAFIDDLDPVPYSADRRISQHYRRLRAFTTVYDAGMSAQPATAQVRQLDLLPTMDAAWLAGAVQPQAPRQLAPALSDRAAGQDYVTALAPQPAQPRRTGGSSAGRKLLAAVLRRVREI